MAIKQVFQFNDAINYLLSNVSIVSGAARLATVQNPSQFFTQEFTDDTGFVYDNTKAEFTGGLVRQNDLRPTNAVLGATYTSSKNLNWSNGGSLIATDIGTPAINAGKLECLNYQNYGVYYESADIGSVGANGTIKFKYTPKYTGNPTQSVNLFELAPPSGNANKIALMHVSSGTLRVSFYDSNGTAIYSVFIIGPGTGWSPTADTEYEFEFTWNSAIGRIQVYINGILFGQLQPGFTRTNTATRLYIGAGTVTTVANGLFNDVLLFSDVQHSANYTPGYSVPEYLFAGSVVQLPAFSYTGIGTVIAVESSEAIETGTPRYIVAGKYWNSEAWVVSNGTYGQANSFADIIANLVSLNVTGALSVEVSLVFPDSNTQSSVDYLTVTVTGQRYLENGYIEPLQDIQAKDLIDYAETVTKPADTDIKACLKIDGVYKYFLAGVLTDSDGSYAQSNTAAEIVAGLASLSLGSNSSVKFRWNLKTDQINTTPSIDEAEVDYNFGGIDEPAPVCLVYGYIRSIDNKPVRGATVSFELDLAKDVYSEGGSNILSSQVVQSVTDINGYFALDLIRSSSLVPAGTKYKVTVKVGNQKIIKTSTVASILFEVPDADTKDITDLLG